MTHLQSNLAHCSDSFSGQLLINVIDILCQLCGDVICIGFISYGSQNVQLQELDVGWLIDAAIEGGVYLHSRAAR